MEDGLERLMEETQIALSTRPVEYYKPLEDFDSIDIGILGEFLRLENEGRQHLSKYEQWEELSVSPMMYSDPAKYIQDQRKLVQEDTQKVIGLGNIDLTKLGISRGTTAMMAKMPDIGERLIEMESDIYESVVAYAKQIASEEGIDPIDTIANPELRIEIYKRIYQKRELFEWYHETKSFMEALVFIGTSQMIEKMLPDLIQYEDQHGPTQNKDLINQLKNLPPRNIIEEYIQDEFQSNSMKAQMVYGPKS